jgi:hypothetical protein
LDGSKNLVSIEGSIGNDQRGIVGIVFSSYGSPDGIFLDLKKIEQVEIKWRDTINTSWVYIDNLICYNDSDNVYLYNTTEHEEKIININQIRGDHKYARDEKMGLKVCQPFDNKNILVSFHEGDLYLYDWHNQDSKRLSVECHAFEKDEHSNFIYCTYHTINDMVISKINVEEGVVDILTIPGNFKEWPKMNINISNNYIIFAGASRNSDGKRFLYKSKKNNLKNYGIIPIEFDVSTVYDYDKNIIIYVDANLDTTYCDFSNYLKFIDLDDAVIPSPEIKNYITMKT